MLKRLLSLVCGICLILSIAGCARKNGQGSQQNTESLPAAKSVREGIRTVLAVSLKAFEPNESGGFRNESQADMLMLMVIDEGRGKTTAVQINPDTMVSFSPSGTTEARQIPLGEVYSYGSGGSDSCLQQLKAVSKLLGGVKIDHYMIFSQGAIGVVSDEMGGITVTMSEDFGKAHPEFTPGEQVRLTGGQADAFFAFRAPEDASNQLHMARQQQFMTALYLPLMEKIRQQEDFLPKLTMKLGDQLSTDLTLSQMVQLMETMESCKLDKTITVLPEAPEEMAPLLEKLFY